MESLNSSNEKFRQFLEQKVLTSIYPPPDAETIKTLCSRPTRPNPQGADTILLSAEPIRENKENVVNAKDGREKVQNPSQWPSSVHGLLAMNFKNKTKWGTGVLIGPNVVLTAGHNLYDHDLKAYADLASMQFMPGMNGQNIPFGDVEVEEYYISPNYLKDEKAEDYGILILKKPIGEKTGYFGLACLEAEEFNNRRINVTGYPADKVPSNQKIYEMWGMGSQEYHIDKEEGHIKYLIDTGSGQSGSGVWYQEGEDFYVCGVHMGTTVYHVVNKATLLTREIYKQIHEWLQKAKLRELLFKLGKTKRLNFSGFDINPEAVSLLMKYNLSDLTCLDLNSKGIGNEGAKILAKNTSWVSLSELILPCNNISAEGIKVIAENISWKQLSKLDLHDNNLGSEGAFELAQNKSWKKLTILHLSGNKIGAKGCKALAENSTWGNLSRLSLEDNDIGAEGAGELARNVSWEKLLVLELQYNKIGREGARALGENVSWKSVTKINLRCNGIDNEGVKALAKNASWGNLLELDLSSNDHISLYGVEAIKQNAHWANLEMLSLEDNKEW